MTAIPAVTVVIPTKDRPAFVARALRVALGQRDVDLEVVVVDDGSGPDARDALAARAAEDGRIRVLRHDRSEGVARARNDGIATARGAWVAFLDDDDVWSPDKLRLQLDAAEPSGAGFAYGRVIEVDERLVPLREMGLTDPARLRRALLAENAIQTPSVVLVRRDLLREAGGFDDGLRVMADWDLWIRLALAAPAAACREPVAAYVRHASGMLTVERDRMASEFARMRGKHAEVAADAGVAFGHLFTLRTRARELLEEDRRLDAARGYLRYALEARHLPSVARAVGALAGASAQDRALGLARRRAEAPPWLAALRGATA